MKCPEFATALIAGLLLTCLACNGPQQQHQPEFRITAAMATGAISVDGLLDETAWQSAQTVTLRDNRSGDPVTEKDIQTWVKACFDEKMLFVGFICNDPDIWSTFTKRDEHLWEEEVVEVFLDTDQDENTYVEIEVSPANVLFDSYIVDPQNIDVAATKAYDLSNIKTAVSVNGSLNKRDDRDTVWTVEIAIPLAEITDAEPPVVPGKTQWKINFYRVNADAGEPSTGYAWSPTGTRFHKPSVFGTLFFEK